MKAKIENWQQVKMTVEHTATLEEWQRIANCLQGNFHNSTAGSDLADDLHAIIAKAQERMHPR